MKSLIFIFFVFSGSLLAQVIDFPDANFKNALINNNCATHLSWPISGGYYLYDVDSNNNGEIEISEAANIRFLRIDNYSIASLEGIQYFTNLEYLSCEENLLNELDLGNMTNLEYLECDDNQLTILNLNNCSNLSYLSCKDNQLTDIGLAGTTTLKLINIHNNEFSTINLQDFIDLEYFYAGDNPFVSINVQNNVNLKYLYFYFSQVDNIDLSNNINLEELAIPYNQLSHIDVSGNYNLINLSIYGNQLTSLDISNNPNIESLSFGNNPLEFLNLKNGSSSELTNISGFYSMPFLEHICVDNNEIEAVLNLINNDTVINSYCSFEPGGEFFTIEGYNFIDIDDNGCDNNDISYPLLAYSITSSSAEGTIVSNEEGYYYIPVQQGTHTIAPSLENPEYFSVSPSSMEVNFPNQASPFIQDFCITPIGDFNDLEVVVIPLNQAIPGFDAEYKILYKNKGTTTLNGEVSFNYQLNEDEMSFLESTPTESSHSDGILGWNFTNLQPFESREILLSFSLNTPTDPVFPLNSGDELGFDITISPLENDETPSDNQFELKQTVVNSFDPNDIRCLEGENITPERVGEYVHYLIRYENLGTANAMNVVVKDVIDETKFDISTLIPLDSSHDFVTRIREDNIVEFIFEDIQLPFDDANNDGYVVFKIKTLETLQLGDTFSNQADIYFDFNAPITTNEYVTTIAEDNLSITEFSSLNISLWPNPSEDYFTLESDSPLTGISIYDLEGRLINEISTNSTSKSVDVRHFQAGLYLIKVHSSGRSQMLKFLKD